MSCCHRRFTIMKKRKKKKFKKKKIQFMGYKIMLANWLQIDMGKTF